MSVTMPGMRLYDSATDLPSMTSTIPTVQTASGGVPSSQSGHVGVTGSYGVTLDATGAVVLFLLLWFGTTGALHYFHVKG